MRKHEASLSKQPEGSRGKKTLADFCFTLHAGNGHDSGRALPDPSDPQLWGGSSKSTVAQLLLGSPCPAQPPAHLQPSNPIPGGLWGWWWVPAEPGMDPAGLLRFWESFWHQKA